MVSCPKRTSSWPSWQCYHQGTNFNIFPPHTLWTTKATILQFSNSVYKLWLLSRSLSEDRSLCKKAK